MKLRTKVEERWITVSKHEKSEEKAQFLVVFLTPKENLDMLEKYTIREWDNNQRFEKLDMYGYKLSRICSVIKDWKDITDEEDKPIVCNNKNKELVYACNPDFINRVLEKIDELAVKIQEGKEEEIKNLLSGQSGSPS